MPISGTYLAPLALVSDCDSTPNAEDSSGHEMSRAGGTSVGPTTSATVSFTRVDLDRLLAAVDENADGWWKSCAMAGIEFLAATGQPFTAHDLVELGVPEPDVPARWGAVMNAASHVGIIVPIAVVCSARPTVHRSLVRQWIGAHTSEGVRA